jgi:hypothetical protein
MGEAELAVRDLDFVAEARLTGDSGNAEVTLGGNADSAIAPRLESFVTDLHEQLVKATRRQVKVDIRGLEQLHASCFDVLVSWLGLVNELPPDQRYQLHFATNGSIAWQKRSLHTLSGFATDLVSVES